MIAFYDKYAPKILIDSDWFKLWTKKELKPYTTIKMQFFLDFLELIRIYLDT